MRKFAIAAAVAGLTALGLGLPATAAQASGTGAQASGCNSKWPGRDGYVRAWDGSDCQGTLLGGTAGNDGDWSDSAGAFQGGDANKASSVMNSGYTGSLDVVKFYYLPVGSGYQAYNCLKASEYFVDNLSRNTFTNGMTMDNQIMGHEWVNASSCSRFMS
ncbi:hypothetical protein ABZX30_01060 [Streptomyces sp. NPDC004542]|uniref:hypothetical protein n=1 Tax=Streptomyces sp. NPDC004542 TaxID=3154281 RepID=UPI0033A5B52F